MDTNKTPAKRRLNQFKIAIISGQAGCATLIVVLAALFIGLWLDSQLGQRGPFTFGLLILSVPLSLTVMLKITLRAIRRMQPQAANTPRETIHDHNEEAWDETTETQP